MGENTKTHEKHSTHEKHTTADKLREQIRHTESDITETVQTLEQKLSPAYMRNRAMRNAKRLGWEGTARVLDVAQRTSVQLSVVGGAAVMMLLSNRKMREKVSWKKVNLERRRAPKKFPASATARALGATALWLLSRKDKEGKAKPEQKPSVSRLAWTAMAANAFMSGANASRKRGSTKPGRKKAWSGLATAIGSALGSYWYSHRGQRV